MLKFIKFLLISSIFIIQPLNAGWLDDIKEAVTGHAKDIKNRFADDELIKGKVVGKGTIDEEAEGQDPLHNGKGQIRIEQKANKHYVQFAKNFYSSPGPDYYVYVSTVQNIKNEKDFYSSKQIELGPLKKGSGATYYEIPNDLKVNSVTVMCKRFREYIASANIVYP